MRFFHILKMLILFAATIITACSSTTDKEKEYIAEHLVQISKEQFKAEKMQLGNVVMHKFAQIYKTNGIVAAAPQSKADVYSYIPGIIKSISVNPNGYVRKGHVLCTIESKEFINIQEQYLESLAKLKAVKADYERVKSLYAEKISSQKDFFAIESEYKVLNAKIQALKAKLKILNVNLKNIENGNLLTYLTIVSPISGYITVLECNIGEFVDSQDLLMEVIDNSDLQLHFVVYQETVNKLKKGQLLSVYSPGNSEYSYKARIFSIGKSIDPETKSIKCIAKPVDKYKEAFITGMYFQVEVITDTLNAKAIPTEAIIKTGDKHYLLVKEKEDANNLFFRKKEISTGLVANGFTQIIGNEELNDILVKGNYYYQK